MGRFISADPLGIAGGLNLYAYAGNNPANAADPSGQNPALIFGVAVGGVTGANQASDAYLATHVDDYTWYGHLGANAKGAGLGIINAFNPFAWWRSLHDSAARLGTAVGCYEGGYASGSDVAWAGANAGFQLVGAASTLTGVGKAAAGGLRALQASGGLRAALARGPCFPAGTAIVTQEGEKPIERVEEGDLVLSADPETGKQSYERVERTFVRDTDELVTIETADGRRIEATPNHPFWVEHKGFIEAERLARSDLLRSSTDRTVAVSGTSVKRGRFTVYNFEVAKTHTYYAAGLWVHNQCFGLRFANAAMRADHFARHGPDFGATTEEFYEAQASHFLTDRDPNALTRVRPNGDRVMYNPTTDEFGVLSRTNTIRTYYRPDPAHHGYPTNLDYFLHGH